MRDASADFHLFHRPKSPLKGWSICIVTVIITNATEELKSLSQNGFWECVQNLHNGWQKHIVALWDYFEGYVA
jgi:hypothetical protein